MDETVLITKRIKAVLHFSTKTFAYKYRVPKACVSYVFSTSGFRICGVYIKGFLKLLREDHLWMGSLAPAASSPVARRAFPSSGYLRQLNHLHVVGRVKPLPAAVLQPPTPALVVLVLGLQKLLPCGDTQTSPGGFSRRLVG